MPTPEPAVLSSPIGYLSVPALRPEGAPSARTPSAPARLPFLAMHYSVSREPRGLEDRQTCILGDVVITRSSDALSAVFAGLCASGQALSEVELSVVGGGGGEIQRLVMRDVIVSGFQFVADPTGGTVSEVIRLRYAECDVSGYSRDADGTLSRSERASWRAEAHELAM